jgi:hypothetical protein
MEITMPAMGSDYYLEIADQHLGRALERSEPWQVSAEIASAQVCAIQAVAAALERLATAAEDVRN